jgi:hypothetical protein
MEFVTRGDDETPAQTLAVDNLVDAGWHVDHVDDDTVYLSQSNPRVRGQRRYAQVGRDEVVQ